jgi:hypothetical protein
MTSCGYDEMNQRLLYCFGEASAPTCVLAANNECTGTCVTGAPCARIISKDERGNENVSCGCGGISPVSSVTRQPGVFGGIADFFNRLFGGK